MRNGVKIVIFDFDDTLIQTKNYRWKHHQEFCREFYDREMPDEKLQKYWGLPYRDLISKLYETDDVDTTVAILRDYMKNKTVPSYPGAGELLEKLQADFILALLTAAPRHFLEEHMDRCNIPESLFAVIQASGESDYHKPDPRVFDPLLGRLEDFGGEPSTVMYIGDALQDYYAARDAGLRFLGISHGMNSREDLKNAGAEVVDSYDELLERLTNSS